MPHTAAGVIFPTRPPTPEEWATTCLNSYMQAIDDAAWPCPPSPILVKACATVPRCAMNDWAAESMGRWYAEWQSLQVELTQVQPVDPPALPALQEVATALHSEMAVLLKHY